MGSDSSWIQELELMFLSRKDVIGLVMDPGTSLLGWNCLAGTSTAWLEQDRNWTGESDQWDRTRRGSGNWNFLISDPILEFATKKTLSSSKLSFSGSGNKYEIVRCDRTRYRIHQLNKLIPVPV